MLDGDTVFSLATGQRSLDVNIIAAYAPEVVARAVLNAINAAEPAGGLPTARSLGFID
jgi:L-aminopeptidase/D-esterase-like protein